MQVDMSRSIIWEGTARLRRYDFIADLHLLAQTLNSSFYTWRQSLAVAKVR